jgi:hypothetical protein
MTISVNSKTKNSDEFRAEAIELVNQGYLAKAIMHLEKKFGNQNAEQRSAALECIKQLAFDGSINSKEDVIGLIHLIK